MFHHTERMCDKHWTISSGQRSGGWFEHVVSITNIFRMIWMMTFHCVYHHNCRISARDAKCTWHGNLLFLTIIFECLHAFRASAAYFSPFVLPDKQKCSDNKMQKVPGWGWDDEALMSGVTEPCAVNTIITSLVSDTIMSRATQWPRISLWYDVIHNIFRDWVLVIKV